MDNAGSGPLSMGAQLKTFLVLIPCAVLLFFLASEIGSDEYTAPILAVIGVVGLCALKLLTNYARFEAVIIGFLLFGYFVGSRGFADLAVVRPFYVGEVCMVLVSLALIFRRVLTRETINMKGIFPKIILLYLFYAVLRWSFDFQTYGIQSVRDLATVYYAVFFFFACQLGRGTDERNFIARCLLATFSAQGLVATAVTLRPDWFDASETSVTLLAQKGDLVVIFSAVGIFFLYTHEHIVKLKWLRVFTIFVLFGLVAVSVARSGIIALLLTSILMWIAGQKKYFVYPGIIIGSGIMMLLLATAFVDEKDQSEKIVVTKEKLLSIVDFSGTYRYSSDFGDMKSANNEFRRTFWKSVIDETNADNPVTGKGFGYDFLPRFEQIYGMGTWEGLRSPHNYFITVYGRMGGVGLLMFSAISFYIFWRGIVVAVAVRRGQVPLEVLGYWCMVWTLLISSGVGVVLEGPMGAVPFWTLLGLAYTYSEAYADEAVTAKYLQKGIVANRRIAYSLKPQDSERATPWNQRERLAALGKRQ